MKKTVFILLFILTSCNLCAKVTPSIVYSKVQQIHEEMQILKSHFNITQKPYYEEIQANLKPRHAWQKTYEIMVKFNVLREINGMPEIEPPYVAPVLDLNPFLTYEQTLRILTEIEIFKKKIGIKKQVTSLKSYGNKTPNDVYNALCLVSKELDLLNGSVFTPSNVFAQVMRVYSDTSLILQRLNIEDHTVPIKREESSRPKDVYVLGMHMLEQIKKLQRSVGIDSINIMAFNKSNITSSDTFSLIQLILAELQPLKAYLGLKEYLTPPSRKHGFKIPADVKQILGWSNRQLSLIHKSDIERGFQ